MRNNVNDNIGGVLFFIVFAIAWTAGAASAGFIPFIFLGFGLIAYSIYNAVVYFKKRKREKDTRNLYGESYPYERSFDDNGGTYSPSRTEKMRFCPYCGAEAEDEYEYCTNCGKKLP